MTRHPISPTEAAAWQRDGYVLLRGLFDAEPV